MSHHIDFQTFLEDQEGEGEYQDTGEFTIDQQHAARKMAKFALPRTTAWVCKLVQAAVGWPVTALSVEQGKVYTVFHYEWDSLELLPTEDELVRGLLSSGISDESPLSGLCLGLRALVETARLSFLLVLNSGEAEPKPVYAGSHFSRMSEVDRLSPTFKSRTGLTITVAHFPPPGAGTEVQQSVDFYKAVIESELDTYCHFSSVPITLNGRRVDDPVRTPAFQATDLFRPIYTGGLPIQDEAPAMPMPQGFEERRMSLFTHPMRARRPYHGKHHFSVGLVMGMRTYPGEPKRRLVVYWVRRGVIIESELLPVYTTVLTGALYLNADSLGTDLTGFKVSATEAAGVKKSTLRRVCDFMAKLPMETFAFAEDRDEQTAIDEQNERRERNSLRLKRLVGVAGAVLVTTSFNPLYGFGVACLSFLGLYGPVVRSALPFYGRDPQALVPHLRSDLTKLEAGLKELARKKE